MPSGRSYRVQVAFIIFAAGVPPAPTRSWHVVHVSISHNSCAASKPHAPSIGLGWDRNAGTIRSEVYRSSAWANFHAGKNCAWTPKKNEAKAAGIAVLWLFKGFCSSGLTYRRLLSRCACPRVGRCRSAPDTPFPCDTMCASPANRSLSQSTHLSLLSHAAASRCAQGIPRFWCIRLSGTNMYPLAVAMHTRTAFAAALNELLNCTIYNI
jgi:hypothetical protein